MNYNSELFLQTPCSSGPCKNNGKCLPLYEENNYKCACNEGFKGDNCENGEKHRLPESHFKCSISGSQLRRCRDDKRSIFCHKFPASKWPSVTQTLLFFLLKTLTNAILQTCVTRMLRVTTLKDLTTALVKEDLKATGELTARVRFFEEHT